MQSSFLLPPLDASQFLILESIEYLFFMKRCQIYCQVYSNFILILKEFSINGNLLKFSLSFDTLLEKFPILKKLFSPFLPVLFAEYFSACNNETLSTSLCNFDLFSNPASFDTRQSIFLYNQNACTILHHDLQICLMTLHFSLFSNHVGSENIPNSLSRIISFNSTLLFEKITFLSSSLRYGLLSFLFRRYIYFETYWNLYEICTNTSLNPNIFTPPLFGYVDFEDTPLRAVFFLHCIHSIFDSSLVFNNFLKTITCYNLCCAFSSLMRFLFNSPYYLQLVRDFFDISNFRQERIDFTEISFPSISYTDASGPLSNISGVNYRSCRSSFPLSQCSGDITCFSDHTFLNHSFIQFPNAPDDQSFYCSRLLPAEEAILKCEEERFELDIVIETAKYTICCLKKILFYRSYNGLSQQKEFSSGDNIKATSLSIPKSTLYRIYGERCEAIFFSLLQYPAIVVPIILSRLNERIQEWKNAQIHFNKIWKENIHRSYIKGFDMNSLPFAFSNIKSLRGRSILKDIESLQENSCFQNIHLFQNTFPLKLEIDISCVPDMNNLMYHILLQLSITQDSENLKFQTFLSFIEDFFFCVCSRGSQIKQCNGNSTLNDFSLFVDNSNCYNNNSFFCNTSWYIFLRSYHVVVSLLSHLKTCCLKLSEFLKVNEIPRTILEDFTNKSILLTINMVYTKSLDLVRDLILSKVCSTVFEQSSKDILGIYFYTLITLEKILPILSRHAVILMNDKSFSTILAQNNSFNSAELERNGVINQYFPNIFQGEFFYQIIFNRAFPALFINRIYFNQSIKRLVSKQSIKDEKTWKHTQTVTRTNIYPLILIRSLKQFANKKTTFSKDIINRSHRSLNVISSNSSVFTNDCSSYMRYFPHDYVCNRAKSLKRFRMHRFLCMLSYFS